MNAHTHRRAAVDDTAELVRLMPAPAVPGLSADRHRMLREQLMQHLPEPSTAGTGTPVPARHRLTRRRVLWGLAPLTAVAAAVATVLTIGAVSGGATGPAGTVAAGTSRVTTPGSTGSDGAAAALLGRLALVAEQQPADTVRDDQYVYIKSVESWDNSGPAGDGGSIHPLAPPHVREIWLSVVSTGKGLLKENGETSSFDDTTNLNRPTSGGLPVPSPAATSMSASYRFLETLPTDPDKLLEMIYASISPELQRGQEAFEQEAFVIIGDLLRESISPPKVTAALYRAAAKIPGVVAVDDATDVAGRHGVAVAFKTAGGQQEWIFDSTTSTFLGEYEMLADGTIVGEEAVLERAVVDSLGETG